MNDITKWKDTVVRLKALKKEETELRSSLTTLIIGKTPMENGRALVKSVLDGYPVKATQKLSYSLDLGALASIWDSLDVVDKEAIKMKPTLQEGKYKKLSETSLLHEAIVTRMAMPILEVGEELG